MEFSRQDHIYDPKKQRHNIVIAGVGSLGSFICLNLAKMGFKNIKIIDYDIVEDHNLPNQFYRTSDLNKPKVEALKEMVKDFADVEITAINEKIDQEFLEKLDVDLNTIFIMAVDSIETRKLIFDYYRDSGVKMIDTRAGGEYYSIHFIDTEEQKEKYEKLFEVDTVPTRCGEKTIIYTVLSIASEVCHLIKRIDREEETADTIRREMSFYRFMGKCQK